MELRSAVPWSGAPVRLGPGPEGQARAARAAPEEQEIRNQILELRTEGFGAYRIAGALNANGIKNPRTLGPWSQETIASILRTADRLARAGAI